MTTPSVPEGFYRASMVFQPPGGAPEQVVTWNGENTSAAGPDVVADRVAHAWFDSGAFVIATLSENWTMVESSIFQVRGGMPESATVGLAAAGTGDFDSEGLGLCLVLTKTTGFAGRRFRGRCFLPSGFFGALTIDHDGAVDATSVSDTTDRWLAVQDHLTADDIPMYLVHYQDPDPDSLNHNTLVTGGHCRSTVHYLRRRQPAGS